MRFVQNITHGKLFFAASYLAVLAIFCSHFLLSLSLIFLALLSIFRYKPSARRMVLNRSFISSCKGVLKWPYLGLLIIFIIHIISGSNSNNMGEYLRQVQVKLPYLLLPVIFLNHHRFTLPQYYKFYFFFIMIACLMTGGVLINYVLNYEELNMLISRGGAIPTPLNHTKFSVLLATALNAGIIFLMQKWKFFHKRNRTGLILAVVFLFGGLHVLAVRSGLVCFYISFVLVSLMYLLKTRKYLAIIGLVATSFLFPIVAYNTIPSFSKKVGYMRYDYQMWQKNGGQGYNDSERLRSYIIGTELISEHPVFGVGIGDIHDDVNQRYADKFKEGNPRQPHNQFLFIATAFGLLGLLFYLLAYFIPFFWNHAYRDPLLLSFFIILTCFCMIEKPLERSSFIVLHCLLVLFSLRTETVGERS